MVQGLIVHILEYLVEDKQSVRVQQDMREEQPVFTITVNEKDLGRVIGRDGQTIRAIRALSNIVSGGKDPVIVDVRE